MPRTPDPLKREVLAAIKTLFATGDVILEHAERGYTVQDRDTYTICLLVQALPARYIRISVTEEQWMRLDNEQDESKA